MILGSLEGFNRNKIHFKDDPGRFNIINHTSYFYFLLKLLHYLLCSCLTFGKPLILVESKQCDDSLQINKIVIKRNFYEENLGARKIGHRGVLEMVLIELSLFNMHDFKLRTVWQNYTICIVIMF